MMSHKINFCNDNLGQIHKQNFSIFKMLLFRLSDSTYFLVCRLQIAVEFVVALKCSNDKLLFRMSKQILV